MSNFYFCFVNIISGYFIIYEYFFSFLKKIQTTPPQIQGLEVSRQSPTGHRTIHAVLRDTCYIWAAYPSFSIEICFIDTEILVRSDFLVLCVLHFTAECRGRKTLNTECSSLVHDSGGRTWSQWDFISPAVHTFPLLCKLLMVSLLLFSKAHGSTVCFIGELEASRRKLPHLWQPSLPASLSLSHCHASWHVEEQRMLAPSQALLVYAWCL